MDDLRAPTLSRCGRRSKAGEALSAARPFARSSRRLGTPPPTAGGGWPPLRPGGPTGLEPSEGAPLPGPPPQTARGRENGNDTPGTQSNSPLSRDSGGGVVTAPCRRFDWPPRVRGRPPPRPSPANCAGEGVRQRRRGNAVEFSPSPATAGEGWSPLHAGASTGLDPSAGAPLPSPPPQTARGREYGNDAAGTQLNSPPLPR